MKALLFTLPQNIAGCFKGRMILWHLIAIMLTYVLVRSGFDWFYFRSTRDPVLWHLMIPAAAIGGLVPLVLPLTLIIAGFIAGGARTASTGWAIIDYPDEIAATAAQMTTNAAGFARVTLIPLITAEEADRALAKITRPPQQQ